MRVRVISEIIRSAVNRCKESHMLRGKSISLTSAVIACLIIILINTPRPISASQYSYDTILPPGWSWSYVHGINDDGDLVGYGRVGSTTKSFIYSGGTYTELLPSGWSSARG